MAAPLQRLIGILGVVYVVATIAPAFFLPPPPPGGAALTAVAAYYTGHRDSLLIVGWIGLLAFPLGFAFVSGLALVFRGEGATSGWLLAVALVSISVTLAVAALQGILALAVPYVSNSAAATDVKLLADITQLGFSATFALEISYFLAIGTLALRSRAIPDWLGYAAGGAITLVALVAGLVWWLLASLLLLVRPRRFTGPPGLATRLP